MLNSPKCDLVTDPSVFWLPAFDFRKFLVVFFTRVFLFTDLSWMDFFYFSPKDP